MKSSQLLNLYNKGVLQKRSARWFKKVGNVEGSVNLPYEVRELIARKSIEAIPKKIRRYMEQDTELLAKKTAMMSTSTDNYDFYASLYSQGESSIARRWYDNKKRVWDAFKRQRPDVYNAYNAWMYRHNKSGVVYWFDNVEFDELGAHGLVSTTLNVGEIEEYVFTDEELSDPRKVLRKNRTRRDVLYIEIDFYENDKIVEAFFN